MWKTLKQNSHYIIMTSYKSAATLFAIWSSVALLTPTDTLLDGVASVPQRVLLALLIILVLNVIIVVIISVWSMNVRKVKVFNLNSNHSLYVELGDLFTSGDPNEHRNIVFAGNRCFDTIVDDDLVGTNKVHGAALRRLYENNKQQSSINKAIQKNLKLHNYSYVELDNKEKRKGNLKRYEVGSISEIAGLRNERYFILGLTYFDSELRARIDKADYIKAINSLVKYISDRSQGFPTYMPVIGTGGSNIGSVRDNIGIIIKAIEYYKDDIDCDIHIVINDSKDHLGILNIVAQYGGKVI